MIYRGMTWEQLQSAHHALSRRRNADLDDLQFVIEDLNIHKEELRVQQEGLTTAQFELEQSRDRYVELYDSAPVGYITLSAAGNICEANLTFASMLQTERLNVIDQHLVRWVDQADRGLAYEHLSRCRRGGDSDVVTELRPGHRKQRSIRVQLLSRRSRNRHGHVTYLTSVLNMTELRRLQQSLQRTQMTLDEAQRAAEAGVWECDLKHRSMRWSGNAYQLLGLQPAQAEPTLANLLQVVHPDDHVRIRWAYRRITQNRGSVDEMFRVMRQDGEVRWLAARGRLINEVGNSPKLVGILMDITSRQVMSQQLDQTRHDLDHRNSALQRQRRLTEELANQLLNAEDEQRSQLAKDLHDDLSQILAAARMKISILESLPPGPEPKQCLTQLKELLGEATRSARSLTFQLAPPILHQLGLGPALDWLGREIGQRFNMSVRVIHDEQRLSLSDQMRNLLFRVARELIINAGKHASCNTVTVQLEMDPEMQCRLEVQDDGRGFDPKQQRQSHQNSFGLHSICGRIEAVGGQVVIDSQPGRGTCITVTVQPNPSTASSVMATNQVNLFSDSVV
ncbi:MAG: PAS domain S-box protein [Phycisphaeraceae bacterium]|nr:PAS domain S-box protein [Phycisphaeraceae bacterium]